MERPCRDGRPGCQTLSRFTRSLVLVPMAGVPNGLQTLEGPEPLSGSS